MIHYEDYINFYNQLKRYSKNACKKEMGIKYINHFSNALPITNEQFEILIKYYDIDKKSRIRHTLPFDEDILIDFYSRLLNLINSKDFQCYTNNMKLKIINEQNRLSKFIKL